MTTAKPINDALALFNELLDEMEALAINALDVLRGKQQAKEYV